MSNKKIIFQVTQKYMKRNRRRTAITFVGILFMVMLMTCVFVGKDTVVTYLQNIAALDKGHWHMMVYDLDQENAAKVSAVKGIDQIGYSARLGFTDFPPSANEQRPYLEVKAYSPETFAQLNIQPVEGRLPENDREIVISNTAVKDGAALQIGDTVEANYFDRSITGIDPELSETVFPFYSLSVSYDETLELPVNFPYYPENDSFRIDKNDKGTGGTYTVVGIIESPYFENGASAGYPALTQLSDAAAAEGTVTAVMTFDLNQVDSVYDLSNDIRERTMSDVELNNMVLSFAGEGSDSVINSLTAFIETFFVILIMAASLILIYNVFNMSYSERTKYLGMLSSVGATGRQKRFSVYYEVLVLLIPALPAGILLGIGVIEGGMLLLKPSINQLIQSVHVGSYNDVPVTISLHFSNLLWVAVMSFVTVMLSALIPARKIGKIGSVESIRGNTGNGRKRFKTKFSLLKKGRAEALLAVNGTRRCQYLTRGIVRSIAVFGVLTAVTLYGAQSVVRLVSTKLGTNDIVYNIKGYDYVLEGDLYTEALYNETKARIEQDSTVTRTKEFMRFFGNCDMAGSAFSDEYMAAFEEIVRRYIPSDEERVQEFLQHQREDPTWINLYCFDDEDYKKLAAAGDADMTIVNDSEIPSILLYRKVELSTQNMIIDNVRPDYHFVEVQNAFQGQIGDDFPCEVYLPHEDDALTESTVPMSLKIAGFLDESALQPYFTVHSEMPFAIINQSAAKKIIHMYDDVDKDYALYNKRLLFSMKDGTDSTLLKELSQLSDDHNGQLFFGTFDVLNGEANFESAIVSIIRILAYCFTALISVVCLLNLYNSVKGRAMERKRETAMLRSMGMTDRQHRKMLAIENLLLLVRGLLIAGILSGAFMLFLNHMITARFGNITLAVPWGLILGITAAICAAMALITVVCYRFSEKESIVEEIRNEAV